MSDHNRRPEPDILDHATGALRDAPVPGGPPPELLAATAAAVAARLSTGRRSDDRRRKIMRYVTYSSGLAAAVAVATVAGVLWTPRESAAAEFKAAMENAGKAKTMVVTNVQKVHANAAEMTFKMSVRGHQLRMDLVGLSVPGRDLPKDAPPVLMSVVADLEELRTIQLNHADKTAVQEAIRPNPKEPGFPDLAENFRRLRDEPATPAGQENVNGKPARVFKLATAEFLGAGGPADVTVWIDPATRLPVRVRVESKHADPKLGSMVLRFEDFRFDVPLDDALFSTDAPKGYKAKAANRPKTEAPNGAGRPAEKK